MLRTLLPALLLCLFGSRGPAPLLAQDGKTKPLPTVAEKTSAMDARPGYFPVFWSADEGRVYLEISRWEEDFLYVNSLAAGLGSNDIGLDRNQLGENRVVRFRRVGRRVLLEERNLRYRAVSDNPDEARSVADAFASSVLAGFPAVAATGEDRLLIDLTPLLLSDAHGVAARLKSGKQGSFKVDADRSAPYLPRTKNFPRNSEFEATVTFVGEATGQELRSVAPTPESFTLRMHHSFVQLPDAGYRPRRYDPRSGYFPTSYADYATPIDQPLTKRFITRHRLDKRDPTAALSDPVEPIVYYLDRGAPEPIRSALLEGARWWDQAFAAAGYRNAFRVEILPADADPLDVRYNVINWVHRSTRGWSYGSSVVDPRTGEIIKGHVLLGSLRVRQDFLLAQGLLAAYADGDNPDPRLEEMALARLRQLSAHEVGHTIGLAHNFAASTNDRASVMDYPHPYVTLRDGAVDLSQAYATGIGEWDKRTVLYGYQDFPMGTDEAAALDRILAENRRLGLAYLSDPDARPAGSSNARAHLWDNGSDPTAEMNRLLALRRHALDRLGPDNLAPGAPLSELEKVLVPVYLMPRYQVEAVAKLIGGYSYDYEVRGAAEPTGVRPVPAERQRAAVAALAANLSPAQLRLPDHLLRLIPPPALGYSRDRESFRTTNGGGLDPLAMATASADNVLTFLLHPHRLARLAEQEMAYGADQSLGLDDYLKLLDQRFAAGARNDVYAWLVRRRFVDHLLRTAATDEAAETVRAAAYERLRAIEEQNRDGYLANRLRRFFTDPTTVTPLQPTELPDGSPIGCGHFH